MAKRINYFKIPMYDEWDEWFIDNYDRSCSGIYGGCDDCLKKMYQKRSMYLTNYIQVFIDNKDVITNNVGQMPDLRWYAAPTAKSFDVEQFHRKKCTNIEHFWLCKQLFLDDVFICIKQFTPFHNVNICSCDTALLLRCCYGYIKEGQEEKSLDQIWARYKNMKKKCKI